ncbi:hypothetical protein AB0395_24425 [Streptosporangium sp. NPDC051023]|uniref:hypothetical protein n=1 Tax=Streptosporangium sp. NPDC051023 TaxID=3155410 RepID=UPI00344EB47C
MPTVRQLLDYLEGLPDDTPVVIDVRPGDEYVQVEGITITTSEDAAGDGYTPTGAQLATRKVLRDAVQRELGELRAALCHTLGKYHREPDPPRASMSRRRSSRSDSSLAGGDPTRVTSERTTRIDWFFGHRDEGAI